MQFQFLAVIKTRVQGVGWMVLQRIRIKKTKNRLRGYVLALPTHPSVNSKPNSWDKTDKTQFEN